MKCGMSHKGLKGLLLMVACCGIPLALLLALPVLGASVGGFGISAISILAVLVCPVGMAVMMWMMMRGQDNGAAKPERTTVVSSTLVGGASSQPLEAAGLSDLSGDREATLTSLPPTDGKEIIKSSRPVNSQQEAMSTSAGGGKQATTPRLN
jgi:hypothetical protein